ncbi:hypothetical protein U1Q18_017737, partial [Sarracenia purpurea var. burkii]
MVRRDYRRRVAHAQAARSTSAGEVRHRCVAHRATGVQWRARRTHARVVRRAQVRGGGVAGADVRHSCWACAGLRRWRGSYWDDPEQRL